MLHSRPNAVAYKAGMSSAVLETISIAYRNLGKSQLHVDDQKPKFCCDCDTFSFCLFTKQTIKAISKGLILEAGELHLEKSHREYHIPHLKSSLSFNKKNISSALFHFAFCLDIAFHLPAF